MAGVGLLAMLDDIASILDDVSLLTKTAAQKTVGVLGDDLALNAQQVSGVNADRELPVIFSVFKGSLLNKLILIPAAIAISAFMPQLVTPLLMIGGAYLCFEGAEKLLRRFIGRHDDSSGYLPEPQRLDAAADEKRKIKGAIRTDFILSAEIIVIALGTVPAGASLGLRTAVLSLIGLLMTIGVYGLVAGIVKLDDAGLYLLRKHKAGGVGKLAGAFLLNLSPRLMRLLAVAGTIAMFLVGGGILTHGISGLRPLFEAAGGLPLPGLWTLLLNFAAGIIAGCILAALMTPLSRIIREITSKLKIS